jgi:hypothetical protein
MTTTEAPVFGRRTEPENTCEFQLVAYRSNGDEVIHQFSARAQVDASTALAAMRGGSAGRDAAYIEKFLIRVLSDADGVGQDEKPTPVTDDADDTPGSDVALREELHTGDWEIDGQMFPSRDLAAQHADENGSSLRRFAKLMDDPFLTVHIDALREILQYVTEQAGRRPLAPSRPSPRRPTQKRRR